MSPGRAISLSRHTHTCACPPPHHPTPWRARPKRRSPHAHAQTRVTLRACCRAALLLPCYGLVAALRSCCRATLLLPRYSPVAALRSCCRATVLLPRYGPVAALRSCCRATVLLPRYVLVAGDGARDSTASVSILPLLQMSQTMTLPEPHRRCCQQVGRYGYRLRWARPPRRRRRGRHAASEH